MNLHTCPRAAFLLQRWDRIGLGIRLAYNPWHPPVIRCYLHSGQQLVGAGVLDEARAQRRMLAVLVQTAADEALPWCWRSACHEHTVFPLARLATLWRLAGRPAADDFIALRQRCDAVGEVIARGPARR